MEAATRAASSITSRALLAQRTRKKNRHGKIQLSSDDVNDKLKLLRLLAKTDEDVERLLAEAENSPMLRYLSEQPLPKKIAGEEEPEILESFRQDLGVRHYLLDLIRAFKATRDAARGEEGVKEGIAGSMPPVSAAPPVTRSKSARQVGRPRGAQGGTELIMSPELAAIVLPKEEYGDIPGMVR